MGDLFAQHPKAGLPFSDAAENEGMALVRKVLDGGPGVADGHLLECHDVLQCVQRALTSKHALEIAKVMPFKQPNDRAHPCGIGENADAVVAVEQRPREFGLRLKADPRHPQPAAVVKFESAVF